MITYAKHAEVLQNIGLQILGPLLNSLDNLVNSNSYNMNFLFMYLEVNKWD